MPNTGGIICFTLGKALGFDQTRYQVSQRQKVRNAKQRSARADHHLRIRRDDVGPLPWHGAEANLVDTQQEPCPIAVVPLSDADELPSAERVKRVSYANKTLACVRNDCSSS